MWILIPTRSSSKRAGSFWGFRGWEQKKAGQRSLRENKKPHHPLFRLSHRTEEKKPLSPRTLPRRPYKVLLATLTHLYQQLGQSKEPGGRPDTVIGL